MKKLTIVLSAAILILSSFTKSDEVSLKVKEAFQKDFFAASEVSWSKQSSLCVASFKISQHEASAVYNLDGELISVLRHDSFLELPLSVLFTVQKKYSGYKINDDILESYSNNEIQYNIKAENEKYLLQFHSDAAGNITVDDKTKK